MIRATAQVECKFIQPSVPCWFYVRRGACERNDCVPLFKCNANHVAAHTSCGT